MDERASCAFPSDLITPARASAIIKEQTGLRVHPKSVARWTLDGIAGPNGRRLLPRYRLGRRLLIRASDLAAFIDDCVEASSSPDTHRRAATSRTPTGSTVGGRALPPAAHTELGGAP